MLIREKIKKIDNNVVAYTAPAARGVGMPVGAPNGAGSDNVVA